MSLCAPIGSAGAFKHELPWRFKTWLVCGFPAGPFVIGCLYPLDLAVIMGQRTLRQIRYWTYQARLNDSNTDGLAVVPFLLPECGTGWRFNPVKLFLCNLERAVMWQPRAAGVLCNQFCRSIFLIGTTNLWRLWLQGRTLKSLHQMIPGKCLYKASIYRKLHRLSVQLPVTAAWLLG